MKQCWCICMYVHLRCTSGASMTFAVHKSWWSSKGPIQTGWSSEDKVNDFGDQGNLPDQKTFQMPLLRTILNHIEAWKSFVIYIRAVDFSLTGGKFLRAFWHIKPYCLAFTLLILSMCIKETRLIQCICLKKRLNCCTVSHHFWNN